MTWQFAQEKLSLQWSPEQISAHAGISPETVYQRVYADKRVGGLLWKNLRCQKLRKKRYGKADRRGMIPNRHSIETRPAIVETRRRIGDWEADTIIGKNHRQAIVSLVERKSGFTLIEKVERKTAQAVSRAMVGLLKPYRSQVHFLLHLAGQCLLQLLKRGPHRLEFALEFRCLSTSLGSILARVVPLVLRLP